MHFTTKNAGLLAVLLTSLVSAAPLNMKREIITHTDVVSVIETVAMTATVWVDPTDATPTNVAPSTTATEAASTETTAAAPTVTSKPSPTYVAPAPTVHEAAVSPAAPVSSAAPISSAAPVSSAAPAPSAVANTGTPAPRSCSNGECIGDVTWYETGMGACGLVSGSDDPIVAVSTEVFDPKTPAGNPNKNPLCGQKISISYNDQTFSATIIDRCVGCEEGDLDLSQGFFNSVTNNGDGRVHNVKWTMPS